MKFTIIVQLFTYSLSIHQLLSGQLAGFHAILNSFLTSVPNTTSTPTGQEGGRWCVDIKQWAKAMSTLKIAKGHPLVPFYLHISHKAKSMAKLILGWHILFNNFFPKCSQLLIVMVLELALDTLLHSLVKNLGLTHVGEESQFPVSLEL